MNFNKGQGLQITVAGLLPVTEKALFHTEWSSIVYCLFFLLASKTKLELLHETTREYLDGDLNIFFLSIVHYFEIIISLAYKPS